ncbi:MAG: hypothetical protein COT84_08225 [Chlamydiae bacterium CG10_big_fil_rev_8_21_14_0_10_35_9]|nr:MAG: hypothetical protein COT84_08225 [Chlamydiae bacterium CG10_big_fil_rev_8_21_14_0_10_35_9]
MKILVFGVPGSGKTHLANKISKTFDLPIFHIDKHFFEKGWVERDPELFLKDVRSFLKKDRWVIDGNGMRTLEMRYKEADIVIYCRLPKLTCLYRVLYRWVSTLNRSKEDGPEGSTNSISWKLIKYLWNFTEKYQEQIKELQMKYPKTTLYEIHTKQEMNDFQKNYKITITSLLHKK